MQAMFEHPFLGRGFRPFFFLGALYSVINLALWSGFFSGYVMPPVFLLDPISWHAHEMIYGFTIAIVAGFLLTAVANWTGGAPARQMHLAGLCLLWASGRVVVNVDMGLPDWLVILIETAFIPVLAVSLAIPLIRSWNKRNFIFLTLLGILFVCDVWFMLSFERTPLYIALMMIMVMISLIGGRIIPAFTVAALRRSGEKAFQTSQMKMDVAALVSLASVVLCFVFAQGTLLFTVCAGVSTVIHALRMRYYNSLRTLSDPMLWILHVGYVWLVIGLLLLSFSGIGIVDISLAIHALTAGCIGSMTLGMMCRVTLGHTGRNLISSKLTAFSFFLMQVAGVMRVFAPLFFPEYLSEFIIGSACLWAICFFFFILIYTPFLWQPRPDGRVT